MGEGERAAAHDAMSRSRAVRTASGLSLGLAGLVILAPAAAGLVRLSPSVTGFVKPRAAVITVPSSINHSCKVNVAAALNSFLASVPADSTVEMPSGACYRASTSVDVAGLVGVTLDGGGAVIRQPSYVKDHFRPVLTLDNDSDVTITDLTVKGPSSVGTEYTEGDYGIYMSDDSDVTLSSVTVDDVKGDGIILSPADDHRLNEDITVTGSTIEKVGYHGVTIQAVSGVTFSKDNFTEIGVDAVDMEVDQATTVFVDGEPTWWAEDGVRFEDDTFSHILRGNWIASLQGQEVQEDDLQLIDNTLATPGPGLSVQIVGNPEEPNDGLVIEGNVVEGTQWSSGSVVDSPGAAVIGLTYVDDVTISGNTATFFDGTPTDYPNTPWIPAVAIHGVAGCEVDSNSFPGALVPLQVDPPSWPARTPWAGTPSSDESQSGNTYGPT